MKNIASSISLFCKKHAFHFFKGLLFGLFGQFYWLYLLPNITPNQHKLFWIGVVFVCALLYKIAGTYAQSRKDIMFYRTWCLIFTIIEAILVAYYFLSQYITFRWI